MFCSKCGAQNDDGARFCVKCGNDLFSANGGDANAGVANQNQGAAFNGAGLKYTPVVGTDGITRNVSVKWSPEEFDRMNPAQLIQALTEIFPVIDELTSLVDNQINLENECKKLEAIKPKDTPKLAANVILLLAAVILCFVIGWFGIFLVIGALVSFAASMLPDAGRKKAHQNRYDTTCKELDEAKRRVNDYIDQNALIIRSAHAVLPDYCYDENALSHILTSLRNYRATSLEEALNLFITDKNAMEQHRQLQGRIHAIELAAENASRAATNS
ncbi:MAG: zinc ribbon domain-containing protein [Clostridiales bacterium]|nr:zinc ribbon domain-containing protein [Clostridiales bacterium]